MHIKVINTIPALTPAQTKLINIKEIINDTEAIKLIQVSPHFIKTYHSKGDFKGIFIAFRIFSYTSEVILSASKGLYSKLPINFCEQINVFKGSITCEGLFEGALGNRGGSHILHGF